jgi:hypothetical protein
MSGEAIMDALLVDEKAHPYHRGRPLNAAAEAVAASAKDQRPQLKRLREL